MGTIWFWLVAFMLTTYVALDGFDLGVGILHLFITRNDDERRLTPRTIGPVWDGNEVWLIARRRNPLLRLPLPFTPPPSAASILPLMIVLWLLILRGISIELRSHLSIHVWRAFFDAVFSLSSAMLAIFLRRSPRQRHPRSSPQPRRQLLPSPLDQLARRSFPRHPRLVHGHRRSALAHRTVRSRSLYLAVKTSGALQTRARAILRILWIPLVVPHHHQPHRHHEGPHPHLAELHRPPHRLHHPPWSPSFAHRNVLLLTQAARRTGLRILHRLPGPDDDRRSLRPLSRPCSPPSPTPNATSPSTTPPPARMRCM